MDAPPPRPPNGRKKRNQNNNNKRRGGGGRKQNNSQSSHGHQPRGPPPAPVLKVSIRNIYRTDVANVVRELVKASNDKLKSSSSSGASSNSGSASGMIVLKEADLDEIETNERIAREAKEAWKERDLGDEKERESDLADSNTDSKVSVSEDESTTTKTKIERTKASESSASNAHQKDPKGGKGSSPNPTVLSPKAVSAHVLYIVSPVSTRRRGEKPGYACVVLTAASIEPKPKVDVPAGPSSKAILDNTVSATATSATDQSGNDAAPVFEREGNEATASSASIVSASDQSTERAVVPPVPDYSRDLAQRRLQLSYSLEALQSSVSVVSLGQSEGGRVVEVNEAVNSKTFKIRPITKTNNRQHFDRLSGTIYDTDDYVNYLKNTTEAAEQRAARPKPAPGGGSAAASTATAGQAPVAALVLHLQKRLEDEKKRKQAKRRAKDVKRKGKGGTNGASVPSNSNSSSATPGTSAKEGKKKNMRRRKKRGDTKNGKKQTDKSNATKGKSEG